MAAVQMTYFEMKGTGLRSEVQDLRQPILFLNQTVHIHSRLNREKTGQLPTGTKCCLLRGGGGVPVSCRVLNSSHQFPPDNDKSGQALRMKNPQTKIHSFKSN